MTITMMDRAEAAERAMMEELDRQIVVKSVIYTSGERDPRLPIERRPANGKTHVMGHDPRLPRMPERPTLFDFFKYRFGPSNHLMQSARLAQKNGAGEKIVLACLLHDIANIGFIRGDHGYWAAQLVEPYVDEEVSWGIRRCGSSPTSRSATRIPNPMSGCSGPNTGPIRTSSATTVMRASTSGT